jgi:NAD(P)-dependent dehydrogenase (short-subunit alcohol dehydrogenase family)
MSTAVSDLNGRVAVVTGGSMGIGLGAAQALIAAGARVVVGSRSLGKQLPSLLSDDVHAVSVDLSERGEPERLIGEARRLFGRIDILVNNVGGVIGGPRFNGFLEVDDDTWAATIEFNLFSAVRACRAAIPMMVEQGEGAIVNVSTYNARQPERDVLDYAAAKAALINLTKSLAREFGPAGIRVNVVAPGAIWSESWFDTGRWADRICAERGLNREDIPEAIPKLMDIPLGRFGRVDEVVDAIIFLASPASSYITGAEILVDGGVTKSV